MVRSSSFIVKRLFPSIVIMPEVGTSNAPMQFNSVLFPDPDSPTTATNSPFSREKDTSFKASTFTAPVPYVLHNLCTFNISIFQVPPFTIEDSISTLQTDEFDLTIL